MVTRSPSCWRVERAELMCEQIRPNSTASACSVMPGSSSRGSQGSGWKKSWDVAKFRRRPEGKVRVAQQQRSSCSVEPGRTAIGSPSSVKSPTSSMFLDLPVHRGPSTERCSICFCCYFHLSLQMIVHFLSTFSSKRYPVLGEAEGH